MKLLNIIVLSSFAIGAILPAPIDKRDGLVKRQTTSTTIKVSTSSGKSTSTPKASSSSTSQSSSVGSSSLKTSTTVTGASVSLGSSTTSTSTSTSAISSLVADPACTNSPFTRACWGNGFSIATDFDNKNPTTGVTRKYSLEMTNTTCAPDGFTRSDCMLINGQFPGPTIYADWGDMIQVTVKNSLPDNGTGIHWHGVRQYHTNTEDGVPGITECPLAPGDTKVYTFQATQYGTSWYHSHFSGQYGEGVLGGIVINGPATANYDVDLGTYMVQDWYYTPVFALSDRVAHSQIGPPTADNGLINGSMVAPSGQTGGKYTTNTITSGKKYRLRFINTSVDNHFMVSLDGHPFTVITADFVPIKPYTTNWIFIGIGERYDVVFYANQTVGSYWFRAEVQPGCGLNSNNGPTLNGNIKSIFTYKGAVNSTIPASTATPYTQRCTDETGLIPFWDSFVPSGPLLNTAQLDVAINIGVTTEGAVVKWGINLTSLDVDWKKPILQYVLDGNNSWPVSENLISLNTSGQWYYWIIQEVPGSSNGTPVSIDVPHPIHLHGHDFYVLGTGGGTYNNTINAPNLDYNNPTRRDVAMLPAGGWLVVAFQTDNPGAWLMHCHIGWHASEGLAVQFLESENLINAVNPISPALTDTCNKWNAWYPSKAPYIKSDSGI
ncbi:laccase, multicopper oxidase, benzenediol:oxygen oxidorectuctase [Ciborinia camelliae]|nr:laccase, multicopper oxidase, benzenediol:oxygen oxidorectuctase [Ciborinia camelliae]